MSQTKIQRGRRRRPDLETLYSVNDDGSRNILQPSDVRGRWRTRKNILFFVLIAVYLVLPWVRIGGMPALLIDLPGRQASILGKSFTREDFYLAFFVLTGFGFALFAATALWGRVWCGYACPQTVFLEGVYRRIERLIEGGRNERLRRNQAGLTWAKLWRKGLKQICFVAVTLVVTHSFLAYFIPPDELSQLVRSSPSENMSVFLFMLAMTGLLYFDFAWFREQFCLILCPYGRLQSAMIDDDTVIVGYDESRGEPRGPKGRVEGDCIDCQSCVNVCPTGIDIRNGLQMECIGCANCIDACDAIMRQLDRPEGLVRYDSLKGFKGQARRFWRPRLLLYAALALVGLSVFLFSAGQRAPFEASALRAQGLPYTLLESQIQNLYTIHVQNKMFEPNEYRIELIADDGAEHPPVELNIATEIVSLEGLAEAKVPIFVFVDRSAYTAPFDLRFRVIEVSSGATQVVDVRFRGP